MKPGNFYLIIFAVLLAGILFYNLSDSSKDAAYLKRIKEIRQEKDIFFKTSVNSPVKDKANFKGLSYFEPDIQFRIKAKISLLDKKEVFELFTSKGKKESYIKFATANFSFNNQNYALLLLKRNLGEKMLFLAFTDLTSGKESYGGGRYLDIAFDEKSSSSNSIELDFNLAYHPYCVYNYDFVCPLPPKKNHLNFVLKAGEKLEN